MIRNVMFPVLFFTVQMIYADWTQWRGSADGQGIVKGKSPVTNWSEEKNIIWKSPVYGTGASSPVISNGRIFLTTADTRTDKMYLVCYEQSTGKFVWERIVFWGNFLENLHKNNTHASGTVATDGKILTVVFGFEDALWLAALDFNGKKLWETEVAKVKSYFGSGTSPVVYKDKVIVLNDMEPNQLLAAYRLADGNLLWKTKRKDPGDAQFHSYSTPRVFNIQGKDRIVTTGLGKVKIYDPETGDMLWDVASSADVTVGTPSVNRRYLYVNGGYPQSGTFAIDVQRREVIWTSRMATYIASMVFHKDYLYAVSNNGELGCIDAKNGTVVWRERFRENIQASPFEAGGHIYLTFRNGMTKVFKPDSQAYIEVAENFIPGLTDATPAVVDGLIYYRGENMLYCIGESKAP